MAVIGSLTPETQKVLDKLNGNISQKEIIKDFFGIRDVVVIAEDGKTILEVINEFTDPVALKDKWVQWNDALTKLWVDKAYFDTLLGNYLNYGSNRQQENSSSFNGSTNELERVENSEKPTRTRKRKSE